MSGFAFTTHRTLEEALSFLSWSPLAFMDSQWLEAHLHLLRSEPARVLAFFDSKAAGLKQDLQPLFPANGEPMQSALLGVPMAGGADAPSFVNRRRELLANALASPTMGIRQQMVSFEMDITKS